MNKDQAKAGIESESLLRQEAKAGIIKREPDAVNVKFGEDVVHNKNDPKETAAIIYKEQSTPMDTLQSELFVESKYQSRRHERIVKEPEAKEAEVPFLVSHDETKEVKFDTKKTQGKLNKTKFSNKKPGKSLNEDEGKTKRKNQANSKFEAVNKAKLEGKVDKRFKVSEDKFSDVIAKKRKNNTKLTEEELRAKAYFTSKLEKEAQVESSDSVKDDAIVYKKQQSLKRGKKLSNTSKIKQSASAFSATKYHVSSNTNKLFSYMDSSAENRDERLQEDTVKSSLETRKYGYGLISNTKKSVSQATQKVKTNSKSVNSRFIPKIKKNSNKDVMSNADLLMQERKNLKRFLVAKKKDEIIFTDIKTSLANKIVSKIKLIASRNKIGVIIAAVVLSFALATLGSVGVLIQGIAQGGGTYLSGLSLSTDFDMTDCENYFTKLEADLQEQIDNIEELHPGFDRYDIEFDDEVKHDPLKLMAYLSAVYEGYDLSMIKNVLDKLFEDMYEVNTEELTENVDGVEIKVFKMTITKTSWDDLMAERLGEDDGDLYDSYELHGGGHQTFKNPFSVNWKSKISSEFGWRIHPITGEEKFHRGVDIAMSSGTAVMSCSEGVVVKSTYTDVEGNYVVVKDESGYTCSYMHLSSKNVSVGDVVDYSTVIGNVGSTGRSTGPHLHLQITDNNGELLNPRFLVEGGY